MSILLIIIFFLWGYMFWRIFNQVSKNEQGPLKNDYFKNEIRKREIKADIEVNSNKFENNNQKNKKVVGTISNELLTRFKSMSNAEQFILTTGATILLLKICKEYSLSLENDDEKNAFALLSFGKLKIVQKKRVESSEKIRAGSREELAITEEDIKKAFEAELSRNQDETDGEENEENSQKELDDDKSIIY